MKHFTILLVDDEEEIIENIRHDLRDLSRHLSVAQETPVRVFIEYAFTAKDALEKMQSSHYDCLLTDINMPGMNGIDFVSKVRSQGFKHPVIFLTAHGDQDKLDKTLKPFHALDFINKPYVKEDLLYLFNEAYYEALDLCA